MAMSGRIKWGPDTKLRSFAVGIVVKSPHNGRPVKVREQDVGRAVRDDEGHVFYVLARCDQNGYFGSTTRGGSGPARPEGAIAKASVVQEASNTTVPHDATGKDRSKLPAGLLIMIVLGTAAAVAYLCSPYGPFRFE